MKSLKATLNTVKVVTCGLINEYGLCFLLKRSIIGWKIILQNLQIFCPVFKKIQ